MNLEIAEPFEPLFIESHPDYLKRFLVWHGGRGSGKSTHAAKGLLYRGWKKYEKILCFRQFQNSMADSVHAILEQEIDNMGLKDFYTVQRDSIFSPVNQTEFIFKGMANKDQVNAVRSIPGLTLGWGEEAQTLSERSHETLVPTFREDGSQIIYTYNVDLETDPTYTRFNVKPPPFAYVRQVNFDENPWFSDVLRQEMEWSRSTDTDAYMHIWMGQPRVHSEAQIFNGKWEISRFEPPVGVEFLHGSDFGFAADPTTAVRMYIHDDCLWIYQESYKHKLDIDFTADQWKRDIPGIEKFIVRCDSARPETISYLQRHGIPNALGVEKWTGSVEDGISFIRSFKRIIIHEQCRYSIQEAKLYSYKRHAQTNDILPEALDKNNHIWDAVRYGLGPMIQQSGGGLGYLAFLGEQHAKKMAGIDKAKTT